MTPHRFHRIAAIGLLAAVCLCAAVRPEAASTRASRRPTKPAAKSADKSSGGSPAKSSGKNSTASSKKKAVEDPRERLADAETQLAEMRKQLADLDAREKSLQETVTAKKNLLAAAKQAGGRPRTDSTTQTRQRIAETSATLAVQRRAEAELAQRLGTLDAAFETQLLAGHVRANRAASTTGTLALFLLANEAAAAEQQRAALASSIQQNEVAQILAHQALAEAEQSRRQASVNTVKLASDIRQLEKDLEQVRADQMARQAKIALLERVRTAAAKEIAGADTKTRTLSAAEKKSAPKADADKSTDKNPDKGKSTTTAERDKGKTAGTAERDKAKPKTTPTPEPEPPKAKPTASPTPARAALPGNVRNGTGLDLIIPEGTVVHAIERGRVMYADRFKGYGKLVILEHPDGTLSLYGFLNDIQVAEGATVSRGQVLGRSGLIEDKDRAGLRFELRLLRDGQEVLIDPRSWLPPGADFQRRLLRGTD